MKRSFIKVTISAKSSISDWCWISKTSSCFLCFHWLNYISENIKGHFNREIENLEAPGWSIYFQLIDLPKFNCFQLNMYFANHSLDFISSFNILKETFSLVLIKIETKLFLKLSWWIFVSDWFQSIPPIRDNESG